MAAQAQMHSGLGSTLCLGRLPLLCTGQCRERLPASTGAGPEKRKGRMQEAGSGIQENVFIVHVGFYCLYPLPKPM